MSTIPKVRHSVSSPISKNSKKKGKKRTQSIMINFEDKSRKKKIRKNRQKLKKNGRSLKNKINLKKNSNAFKKDTSKK